MGFITQEVALTDVRFFSPIGYYEEERLLGNEFFVDFCVAFPYEDGDAEVLTHTLNYEELYNILRDVMKKDRKLLESAAKEILDISRSRYGFANKITISIRKTTPPFGRDHIHSRVSITYTAEAIGF
ncbi:dihydroneopterin aldolase [Sphingobacterium deserti]|nr:dihydroneopterin aldolase [Sphingobacterium deserti]